MKEFVLKMLSEKGDVSSMRVMSFEIVQVALAVAVIAVIRGTLSADTIGLVLGLLTVALTGKVTQKSREGSIVADATPPEAKS